MVVGKGVGVKDTAFAGGATLAETTFSVCHVPPLLRQLGVTNRLQVGNALHVTCRCRQL